MNASANSAARGSAERQERAQRVTGAVLASPQDALVATLDRIADLHADLASAYRDLASEAGDIQLEGCPPARLMSDVPTTTPGPDLLTVEDLAERLRVSAKTIRGMERDGRLPKAMRLAGLLRWKRESIETWLDGEAAR